MIFFVSIFVFIESIEMRQWGPKKFLFFTLVLIGMMFSDVQLCKDNPTNFYLFKSTMETLAKGMKYVQS